MRILQSYRFCVGTKIPFDKWPGIVEDFLHQQNLSHRSFHYYLASYDNSERYRSIMDGTACESCSNSDWVCEWCRNRAEEGLRKGTACERAVKENPFLGHIHVQEKKNIKEQYVHNFSHMSNDCKEALHEIRSKLYRCYGFAETVLIYRDINFFSQWMSPPPPERELFHGYLGSGITLLRSCIGKDSAIILTVEAAYPGEVQDAAPYAEAFGQLLPGIKRLSATKILMDADEQASYGQLHDLAKPLVGRAKELFENRMPEEKGNEKPAARVSVASWLKKLSKRYGYTYHGYDNYVYYLDKKLSGGHYICLEFLSNPLSPDGDPVVNLCGLGFMHRIWMDGFSPQNPSDAEEYFTQLFDTLAEAEQSVFPAILDLYPPTPDWFIPTHDMNGYGM